MLDEEKKIERLVQVAELYYTKNKNQSEIAAELGISRPLVSVLLNEARQRGIVTITINHAHSMQQLLADRLKRQFGVGEVILAEDRKSAEATDDQLAEKLYAYCFGERSGNRKIGIGWGSVLGRMADYAEKQETDKGEHGTIFPLIGGIGASYRGYHTNEIARIVAMHAGLRGEYLYLPAFFDSADDLAYARRTEIYRELNKCWEKMDLAVIAVSNASSYPDLGAEYRFGGNPVKKGAAGRILAYYYDAAGKMIVPEVDNVLQASAEQLRHAKKTVAVCSALLQPKGLAGALALGIIDVLMLPESLALKLPET